MHSVAGARRSRGPPRGHAARQVTTGGDERPIELARDQQRRHVDARERVEQRRLRRGSEAAQARGKLARIVARAVARRCSARNAAPSRRCEANSGIAIHSSTNASTPSDSMRRASDSSARRRACALHRRRCPRARRSAPATQRCRDVARHSRAPAAHPSNSRASGRARGRQTRASQPGRAGIARTSIAASPARPTERPCPGRSGAIVSYSPASALRHAVHAAGAAGETVQHHQRRTAALGARSATCRRSRGELPVAVRRRTRRVQRAVERRVDGAVHRTSITCRPPPSARASAASNAGADSMRAACQPRPRARCAQVEAVRHREHSLEQGRGSSRAAGRYSKMPPPSSLPTTIVRLRLHAPGEQASDVVQQREIAAPQHRRAPQAAAAPSAQETRPSMPLTPRFASTRSAAARGPANASISRMAMLFAT